MVHQLITIIAFTAAVVQGARNRSTSRQWVGYCKVPHCDKGRSHTQCEECEEGYFQKNWECYPCTQIDTDCVKCSNKDTCTGCREGFYLSSGGCQKCPEGCSSCTNENSCDSCEPGYGKVGSMCVLCDNQVDNCAVCPTAGTGPNVVDNPSFEDPVLTSSGYFFLTSWNHTNPFTTLYGPAVHVGDTPDGQQALVVITSSLYYETQTISGLTPGQECSFSFYYRASSFNNTGINLVLNIGGSEVASVNTQNTEWILATGTFTPTAETEDLSFLLPDGTMYTGYYVVDLIVVTCPSGSASCTQCNSGFFESEGSCVSCPEYHNDSECNNCDVSECKGCIDTFYLDGAGQCVACEEKFKNCKVCSVDGEECEECKNCLLYTSPSPRDS